MWSISIFHVFDFILQGKDFSFGVIQLRVVLVLEHHVITLDNPINYEVEVL